MATDNWAWGWESISAIATMLATVSALAIAIAPAIARLWTRRSRAELALVKIWPDMKLVQECLGQMLFSGPFGPNWTRADFLQLSRDCDHMMGAVCTAEGWATHLLEPDERRFLKLSALCTFISNRVRAIDADRGSFVIDVEFMRLVLPTEIARANVLVQELAIKCEKASTRFIGRFPYESELQKGLDDTHT